MAHWIGAVACAAAAALTTQGKGKNLPLAGVFAGVAVVFTWVGRSTPKSSTKHSKEDCQSSGNDTEDLHDVENAYAAAASKELHLKLNENTKQAEAIEVLRVPAGDAVTEIKLDSVMHLEVRSKKHGDEGETVLDAVSHLNLSTRDAEAISEELEFTILSSLGGNHEGGLDALKVEHSEPANDAPQEATISESEGLVDGSKETESLEAEDSREEDKLSPPVGVVDSEHDSSTSETCDISRAEQEEEKPGERTPEEVTASDSGEGEEKTGENSLQSSTYDAASHVQHSLNDVGNPLAEGSAVDMDSPAAAQNEAAEAGRSCLVPAMEGTLPDPSQDETVSEGTKTTAPIRDSLEIASQNEESPEVAAQAEDSKQNEGSLPVEEGEDCDVVDSPQGLDVLKARNLTGGEEREGNSGEKSQESTTALISEITEEKTGEISQDPTNGKDSPLDHDDKEERSGEASVVEIDPAAVADGSADKAPSAVEPATEGTLSDHPQSDEVAAATTTVAPTRLEASRDSLDNRPSDEESPKSLAQSHESPPCKEAGIESDGSVTEWLTREIHPSPGVRQGPPAPNHVSLEQEVSSRNGRVREDSGESVSKHFRGGQSDSEPQSVVMNESPRAKGHVRTPSDTASSSTVETKEIMMHSPERRPSSSESCASSSFSSPLTEGYSNFRSEIGSARSADTEPRSPTSCISAVGSCERDDHTAESSLTPSVQPGKTSEKARKGLLSASSRAAQEERLRSYEAYLEDPGLSPSFKKQVRRAQKIALQRLNLGLP